MAKRGSKRQALRFRAEGHNLRYKTEFEDGHGILANISINGCALSEYSVSMKLGERILLLIALEEKEKEIEIEIGAEVVRKDGATLAVKFLDISENNQHKIITFFAKRQRTNT